MSQSQLKVEVSGEKVNWHYVASGGSAGFQALRSQPGVADPQHQMWINDLVGIDEMELPAFNGSARLRIVR